MSLPSMDNEPIDFVDPEKHYKCSDYASCPGFTLLHKWVMMTNKHPELLLKIEEYLKVNPEKVDTENEQGWTALHLSSLNSNKYSSIETVKLLLDNGADPNHNSYLGMTPLVIASGYTTTDSSIETCELLLEVGTNINMKSLFGWTALHAAVRQSNRCSSIETIELLLKNGANPNIQEIDGYTPLCIAAVNNEKRIWCPKYIDKERNTKDNISIVLELLLKSGADPNIKNNMGVVPKIPQKILNDVRFEKLEQENTNLKYEISFIKKQLNTMIMYHPESDEMKFLRAHFVSNIHHQS